MIVIYNYYKGYSLFLCGVFQSRGTKNSFESIYLGLIFLHDRNVAVNLT